MNVRKEIVPLADRMTALLVVRFVFAAIVLGSARLAPTTLHARPGALAGITAGYALTAVAGELARRVGTRGNIGVATALLLVDGAYLWLVLARTGGPTSVLGFLVYVHVVAVTLLVSYRTGLKVAVWHGLLLFAVFYARQVALWPSWTGSPAPGGGPVSAFAGIAFWLIAIATASLSSLNERELRRGKAELDLMAQLGARLQHASTVDEVRTVVADVTVAFGFRRAAVVTGPDALVQASWSSGEPVLARSVAPTDNAAIAEALPGAGNVVVAPCVVDDTPIGALVAERGGGADVAMARHTVELVAQVATQAAMALRAATLRAEVARLATTDGLTGLPNRRTFDAALARELARAGRTGEPCGLILFDVDHFKSVNDTHGHQVGDEVLRGVGAALARSAREFDVPARYGGEEFAVVAPGCGRDQALAMTDRLRAAIAAEPGPVAITVSAGVAVFPPDGVDANTLIAAADEALYASKRAGRDRATLASWSDAPALT